MENKIFTLHKTVTEADTAAHVGSGSLPVLATRFLLRGWKRQPVAAVPD